MEHGERRCMNGCRMVGAPHVLENPGEPTIAFGTIGA
jgi:hypothetical protein